jgi:hypothetical protein
MRCEAQCDRHESMSRMRCESASKAFAGTDALWRLHRGHASRIPFELQARFCSCASLRG